MKLFEFKYDPENGITIKRESEERLTAEQKHNLLMALFGLTAFCFFIGTLFGGH